MGRFTVTREEEGSRFLLQSEKGTVLATSRTYATLDACKKGINSLVANAPVVPVVDRTVGESGPNPKFEVTGEEGHFVFSLKAANGKTVITSAPYATKKALLRAISMLRRGVSCFDVVLTRPADALPLKVTRPHAPAGKKAVKQEEESREKTAFSPVFSTVGEEVTPADRAEDTPVGTSAETVTAAPQTELPAAVEFAAAEPAAKPAYVSPVISIREGAVAASPQREEAPAAPAPLPKSVPAVPRMSPTPRAPQKAPRAPQKSPRAPSKSPVTRTFAPVAPTPAPSKVSPAVKPAPAAVKKSSATAPSLPKTPPSRMSELRAKLFPLHKKPKSDSLLDDIFGKIFKR